MSNQMEAVYMVQYKHFYDGSWMETDGVRYTRYQNAVKKMGDEMSADPDYNHRIIRWERSVVVEVKGTYEEER